MTDQQQYVAHGLAGVVAAATKMSMVDGQRGHLVIRGYALGELAGHHSFEEALGLLWDGALPDPTETQTIQTALAEGRVAAFERLGELGSALEQNDAMAALRGATAQWEVAETRRGALKLIGALPVWVGAWWRKRQGLTPSAPNPSATHSSDTLAMIRGNTPNDAERSALDTYLTTVIDHGMNASTFTARVVASTGSDLTSAVAAAIGALKGPLHGGAPGPVLDMLDAIGKPDAARPWLDAALARDARIMGMGHRVYKVRDPRAAVLEGAVARLQAHLDDKAAARLALAQQVEREAEAALEAYKPGRHLRANVEFYTAVLLEALQIPRELFSATFCVSRAAGWCAHVFEQRAEGRLMRPRSLYVGPMPKALQTVR